MYTNACGLRGECPRTSTDNLKLLQGQSAVMILAEVGHHLLCMFTLEMVSDPMLEKVTI